MCMLCHILLVGIRPIFASCSARTLRRSSDPVRSMLVRENNGYLPSFDTHHREKERASSKIPLFFFYISRVGHAKQCQCENLLLLLASRTHNSAQCVSDNCYCRGQPVTRDTNLLFFFVHTHTDKFFVVLQTFAS